MPRLIAALAVFLLLATPTWAKCTGQNLLAFPDKELKQQLTDALADQPYPTGNFWRATRNGQTLHLIGTYHLDDPRHDATIATLTPLIQSATTVLVEAGPAEETALKSAMARDPSVMLITEGPSLLEQLRGPDWDALATAMQARGIPPFVAAKFKPWYVSLLLGIPPCAMADIAAQNGLDKRVMRLADAAAIPVVALEPYDTILKMFATMPAADQLAMIRSTLPLEPRVADFSATLENAYFAQDTRRIWEFMRIEAQSMPGYTPAQIDAEFALMEEVLMSARNRAWLPVIEATAAKGSTFIAFGALHLSGRDGVLNLLAQSGWTLERLPL
ncbi:MAG: TraB/GumN family protein [Paracoccaceae bacterium]